LENYKTNNEMKEFVNKQPVK